MEKEFAKEQPQSGENSKSPKAVLPRIFDIPQLLLKDVADLTEEERAAVLAHKEQMKREDEEYARQKEERERRKRESDAAVAAYFEGIKTPVRQEEGSIGWFMKQIDRRTHKYATIRIDNENLPEMMRYAYRAEVERRGRTMKEDSHTLNAIDVVCRWLTSHERPGLMLLGYIGVGKTTMMYAIQAVLDVVAKQTLKIADANRIAAWARENAAEYKEHCDAALLGIDDLGTEPGEVRKYGNEVSPVQELLTERYNGRRFTIVTTNLTREQLAEVYGERLYDRFCEMFNFMTYDSEQKSYRQ